MLFVVCEFVGGEAGYAVAKLEAVTPNECLGMFVLTGAQTEVWFMRVGYPCDYVDGAH